MFSFYRGKEATYPVVTLELRQDLYLKIVFEDFILIYGYECYAHRSIYHVHFSCPEKSKEGIGWIP